jgi:hypothetical protein
MPSSAWNERAVERLPCSFVFVRRTREADRDQPLELSRTKPWEECHVEACTVIGILARNGTIHMVDDDGYDSGTMLAANRMELCYSHLSARARIVSCTELTKQP